MKKETIGEIIRNQRKKLGLTAEQLAKKIGVDRTYISKIEKHNLLPSFAVISNLRRVLGIDNCLTLYINQKFPDLYKKFTSSGSELIIPHSSTNLKNIKNKSLLMQEILLWYIRDETETTHKAFALDFLAKYIQSKANNEKAINKIIKYLKKMRQDKKDFWVEYKKQEKKLLKDLTDSK